MSYKLKFIDSYRFMQSKLSGLVDNLSETNKKECPECLRKILSHNVNLLDLKMMHYITDAKNVKKYVLS